MIKSLMNDNENKNKIVIAIVLFSITIIIALVNTIVGRNNQESEIENQFRAYSATYYEKGFYDEFLNIELNGDVNGFSAYTEKPIIISAKEIFDGTNINPNQYFKKDGYLCSLNTSVARFFPVAPYGKTDYKLEIAVDC